MQVTSAEEAMLILRLGIRHRHVASTRLNYQSSRSHSIYTIKLVKLARAGKPFSALINRSVLYYLSVLERVSHYISTMCSCPGVWSQKCAILQVLIQH